MEQTVFIKGMVCQRCMLTVEKELTSAGHQPLQVSLGEVSFIPGQDYDPASLEKRLSAVGFSVLEDRKSKLVKEVKSLVEEVYSGEFDFPERFRLSELLSKRLQKEYETISDTFIAGEKTTIEQYVIQYRINKIKEFLVYSDSSLADIAFRLNYSSVAHLSAQFKQNTGLTPSYFRNIRRQKTGAANANQGANDSHA
jgi:AraC-like DNA-binding protein